MYLVSNLSEYCIPVNILILVIGLLLTTAGHLHKIGPDEPKLFAWNVKVPLSEPEERNRISFYSIPFLVSFWSDFKVGVFFINVLIVHVSDISTTVPSSSAMKKWIQRGRVRKKGNKKREMRMYDFLLLCKFTYFHCNSIMCHAQVLYEFKHAKVESTEVRQRKHRLSQSNM